MAAPYFVRVALQAMEGDIETKCKGAARRVRRAAHAVQALLSQIDSALERGHVAHTQHLNNQVASQLKDRSEFRMYVMAVDAMHFRQRLAREETDAIRAKTVQTAGSVRALADDTAVASNVFEKMKKAAAAPSEGSGGAATGGLGAAVPPSVTLGAAAPDGVGAAASGAAAPGVVATALGAIAGGAAAAPPAVTEGMAGGGGTFLASAAAMAAASADEPLLARSCSLAVASGVASLPVARGVCSLPVASGVAIATGGYEWFALTARLLSYFLGSLWVLWLAACGKLALKQAMNSLAERSQRSAECDRWRCRASICALR